MNLYFECAMGAAGDMLASALFDLFDDKAAMLERLNSLKLPHTIITYEVKEQKGIFGAHLNMLIDGETETPDTEYEYHRSHHREHRHGRSLDEVLELIDGIDVSDKVKSDVKAIYTVIAEAESKAHNKPAGEVHFHELGMFDAIADITVSAYLINELKPDRILASPINVGNGTLRCAHGILPVPAPSTAEILTDVPYYKSDIMTELCTPTGAAVLKYYADEFSDTPSFERVCKIGTGVGTKELERANIFRAYSFEDDTITELSCNVDDMTGEEIGFAADRIMKDGALDCFVTPAFMKKGRPAYMLTVLCSSNDTEKFVRLIFKHTTTIGIRKYTPSRYTLKREIREENGVHIKRSEGCGATREKVEFEDIKKYAIEKDVSIFEAREQLAVSRKP